MPSSADDIDSDGRIPVLIVGAGPAGLVLALELARRNIGVRIVEKADAPRLASRAKGLQPRTLEIFDDLGLIDAVREDGGEFPRWRSHDGARLLWEKSIWELLGRGRPVATAARPYPATWMIPQWRTEDILRNALLEWGVTVEFGVEFLWPDEDMAGVAATVRKDGGEEKILCRYLVGADGAGSAVRKALGIDFPGETSTSELYMIADVKADALEPGVWMNWAPGGDASRRVSLCSLPRSDYFQFVAPLAPDRPVPELSLGTLQALFDERTGRSDMLLSDARWIVSHRPNTRLAEEFREGAVFLAGDAAHSAPTSPGQGLNISIQDAYNLGWKLAAVVRGADPALLNSYEEERRPIAAGVLGVLAGLLTEAGLSSAEAQERQEAIRGDIFHLDHNYRDSSLSLDCGDGAGPVQAGDRAPDGFITGMSGRPARLFDLLRGVHLLVLNFVSGTNDLASALAPQPGLRVVVVPPTAANLAIRRAFGVTGNPVQFLIRPDGYVAVRSARAQDLEDWLHRVFG